eukprot:2225321-Rhodomonas_salina.4
MAAVLKCSALCLVTMLASFASLKQHHRCCPGGYPSLDQIGEVVNVLPTHSSTTIANAAWLTWEAQRCTGSVIKLGACSHGSPGTGALTSAKISGVAKPRPPPNLG